MLLRLRGFLSPPRCEAVQAVHGEREREAWHRPLSPAERKKKVLPCPGERKRGIAMHL